MSAVTRCDECGEQKDSRRLKVRVSLRLHAAERELFGVDDSVTVVEVDLCSDQCLIAFGQRRIRERSERLAREHREHQDAQPSPMFMPPRTA